MPPGPSPAYSTYQSSIRLKCGCSPERKRKTHKYWTRERIGDRWDFDLSCTKRAHNFGLVWLSAIRFGSVRFGSVRFGSVRFGSVRFGSVRFGSIRWVRSGWVRFRLGWIGLGLGWVELGWFGLGQVGWVRFVATRRATPSRGLGAKRRNTSDVGVATPHKTAKQFRSHFSTTLFLAYQHIARGSPPHPKANGKRYQFKGYKGDVAVARK